MMRVMAYPAESYAGSCKSDKASIPSMRLMNGVGVIIAKLFENQLDPGPVFERN